MSKIEEVSKKIKSQIQTVYKGNPKIIDKVLSCLFSGGHILLEDVPGTGKTVLAKALAKSTSLSFSRIQCTPDLMPSDVTGSSIYLAKEQNFEFRKGPVFSSILLVDELNRATPRTQSALLECMAESQVSADGNLYKLEKPFFVIATQNPVESEGTFPLPEAQKDRFTMMLSLGYPSAEDEKLIITNQRSTVHPVENVQPCVSDKDILDCQEEAVSIHVEDSVLSYIVELAEKTRNDSRLAAGVSTRGTIALYKACQAYAAISGRDFVTPEDVKELAENVFVNRVILSSESVLKGFTAQSIISDILMQVPIPEFSAHV